MEESTRNTAPDFEHLPGVTFRQLEVFGMVCRERSYANAAVELRNTRANVKRVCQEFEKAIGRTLFEEAPDRLLQPTPFAVGLLSRVQPLSRSLRRLGESVRAQHEGGRILRFAAAGEFFRGGLFTTFLGHLKVTDLFRPCFLRMEVKRFRTALLNAECDVYFGVGLVPSERLDFIDLGPVPWRILGLPESAGLLQPQDLAGRPWQLVETGDAEVSASMLEQFRAAGATGGATLTESAWSAAEGEETAAITFMPDLTAAPQEPPPVPAFPCHRFLAVARRNHPYAELQPRLEAAARLFRHGH